LPAASTTVQCVVAKTSPGVDEDWLEYSEVKALSDFRFHVGRRGNGGFRPTTF